MKKILLFSSFLILISTCLSAQSIQGFAVYPPNPTTADTITVIVETQFPSGSCDGEGYFNGVSGNEISAGGLHCMGMLAVICTDYDTVIVPPQSQGSYLFVYVLSTGQGIPCIPGILPLVIDSTHIVVTDVNHTPDMNKTSLDVMIRNNGEGKFIIEKNFPGDFTLNIFSIDGRMVNSYLLKNPINEINESLPKGIYSFVGMQQNKKSISKIVVK
jgi:hypothetical protein